jgi:hypothetical protein
MTDPGEIVTGIFTAVVMGVVALMMYGAFNGWDITAISSVATSLAVPFVIGLIGLFAILQIAQMT